MAGAAGELFSLRSSGEFRPLQQFRGRRLTALAGGGGRLFVACDSLDPAEQCSVYCFGDCDEPVPCAEFEVLEGLELHAVAVGDEHLLAVVGEEKALFSAGSGAGAGHGGARDVPCFAAVPALTKKRMRAVAAGGGFSMAIAENGDVFAWGKGPVPGAVESVPRFLTEATKLKVAALSCGSAHVLALTEDGRLAAWGDNSCGQLGLGKRCGPQAKPCLVDVGAGVAHVAAGWAHSLAVCDGAALAWGLNAHGQLGVGDTKPRLAPARMEDLEERVEEVAAARALSLLRTRERVLLAGRMPGGEECRLCPTALPLASGASRRARPSALAAFAGGCVAVAKSRLCSLEPSLAPLEGGARLRLEVTGLPEAGFARPQVRLRCAEPACEIVVPGDIHGPESLDFASPALAATALGPLLAKGEVMALSVQASLDGGETWTEEEETLRCCRWPEEGATSVEPRASPVTGGVELLLRAELPRGLPEEGLTVRFLCGDVETAKVPAWPDPQGLRCRAPAVSPELAASSGHGLQLALDGRTWLGTPLPFAFYDLHVAALRPCLGPAEGVTLVRLRATGTLEACALQARLDVPGREAVLLPAELEHTSGEVLVRLPPLPDAEGEVRACLELSLDGQHFTADNVAFAYHAPLQLGELRLLETASSSPAEAKKGKEADAPALRPGARLGCTLLRPLPSAAAGAAALLLDFKQEGAEAAMPGVKSAAAAAPERMQVGEEEEEVLVACLPEVKRPEGSAPLFLVAASVCLNGQSSFPVPLPAPLRLE